MEPRSLPSLKRYLARTIKTLEVLRGASQPQWDFSLTPFEELVIVLEDRRFLLHRGLDWKSIVREALKAMTLRQHGGASTIEMQYIRTVTGRYERTLARKLQEMVLSILLGYHLDKITILRSYLALAYFGTGLRGQEEASWSVFGKSSDQLSIEEAAMLASMLVYPLPRSPSAAWRTKIDRRAAYGQRLRIRLQESLKKPSV